MTLYFLRHGEAGMSILSDAERALTDRGIKYVRSVGKFLASRNSRINHLLCSPLVRARQTAETVLGEIPPIPIEESEFLTPESDPKNLLQHLRSYPPNSGILCITHEPFVSNCISILISGHQAVNITIKTATVACVESSGHPSPGNGRLLWLLPPETTASLFLG